MLYEHNSHELLVWYLFDRGPYPAEEIEEIGEGGLEQAQEDEELNEIAYAGTGDWITIQNLMNNRDTSLYDRLNRLKELHLQLQRLAYDMKRRIEAIERPGRWWY
ncbi:hypothetical protein PG994_003059 [Apiospora phragmitis]|uniref:Uncharacterized protein n=1 Tax=Apiospora phragmitis TaxID=2905665 RepID=A0ABR1W873_9PEZI